MLYEGTQDIDKLQSMANLNPTSWEEVELKWQGYKFHFGNCIWQEAQKKTYLQMFKIIETNQEKAPKKETRREDINETTQKLKSMIL